MNAFHILDNAEGFFGHPLATTAMDRFYYERYIANARYEQMKGANELAQFNPNIRNLTSI